MLVTLGARAGVMSREGGDPRRGPRAARWNDPACAWDATSSWLVGGNDVEVSDLAERGGANLSSASTIAANDAPSRAPPSLGAHAPTSTPAQTGLTPEQKARILANREAALARRRAHLERRAGVHNAHAQLCPAGPTSTSTSTPTPTPTPPRPARFTRPIAPTTVDDHTEPIPTRLRATLAPPSPVREHLTTTTTTTTTTTKSGAVAAPFGAAPPPPTRSPLSLKRRFAAALDDAFAVTDTVAASASASARPDWLVRPVDDAGFRRPSGAHRPTLEDALSTLTFDAATLRVFPSELARLGAFARQFWSVKSRLMDCAVMCRHGSFYNLFDVDSEIGLGVGLRLSGRPAAFMQKVGCHRDHFDAWAAKLLGQGHAVARVEETGDRADGILRREVVEILTPALDRGLLRDDGARRLLALAEIQGPTPGDVVFGVAVVDAASGDVALGDFVDGPSRDALASFLAVVEPREVLVSRSRPEGAISRESLAAMRHHARRDAADDPDAIPVALRVIERGVAPTPRFSREDTLDAVRRFGGFDARDAPPPALARAADVAMEALAYATRHMAWAGAASAVLCQGRFRNLNGGVGGGVKGRDVDGVTGHASAHSASAHSAHSVRLDASTVRSLHLVRGGEGVGRAGSLLAYLDVAVTGPGRRRLREWILQPLRRVAAAEARHDAVDALVDRPNVAANLRAALAAIPSDAQRGIARATALAKALEDASEAARERGAAKVSTVGGGNAESISGNVSGFDAFDGFDVGAARGPTRRPGSNDPDDREPNLDDEEAAVAFWSSRRAETRDFLRTVDAVVAAAEALAGLPADARAFREFRAVGEDVLRDARDVRDGLVPVPACSARRGDDPARADPAHYDHILREPIALASMVAFPAPSASDDFDDAVAFAAEASRRGVTPEDDPNVRDAIAAAAAIAAEAVAAAVTSFAARRERWRAAADAAADLDALLCFATRAGGPGFVRPVFLDDDDDKDLSHAGNCLSLRGSWHPLARALGPDGFVRNDVALGDDGAGQNSAGAGRDADSDQNASSASLVALTGPNMGGKSTLLRQVALAVVMAHAGCRAPASDLRMHPVDAVACRVGAGDGVAAGTSTFLAEMADASAALRRATRRSLLVFDELGRGTSTSDGYAIAFAVARAVARVGARCLFATHYHALAADVRASGGAGERATERHMGAVVDGTIGTNASDRSVARVRFTYRLEPGPAPLGSCAAHAATLAGFPEGVLRRAAEVASGAGGPSRNVKTPKTTPTLPPTLPPTLRGVMREDAFRCFEALAADPVVEGVPGAAGDDAWAATFFALWTRCARLSPSLGPD